jgi:hypothetical protein
MFWWRKAKLSGLNDVNENLPIKVIKFREYKDRLN